MPAPANAIASANRMTGLTRLADAGSDGSAPTCTIVVCTRDRHAILDRCLTAVMQLRYPSFEVLIVDNAPSDQQTREIAARWGVRYLREPRPGLSRARNCGVRACATPIIAFLDDDATPEPEWLAALITEFADPMVMIVAGRIVPLRLETEAEHLAMQLGGLDSGTGVRRVVDRHTPLWFELACFGGLGNGANMAFHRRAFDVWPGFDERLGAGTLLPGGEEGYAFFSLIDRGYRVVYTPSAIVRHPCPSTLPELRARHLRQLTAATAYLTLLFVEQPRYRGAVVRYVAQALRGNRRPWRSELPPLRVSIIPAWRRVLAMGLGPWLYLRARLQKTRTIATDARRI